MSGGDILNLNLNDEKSIYLQISETIEDDILRDILLEEERVPSTNELARHYGINPATAAKGVNILVDKSVLYKKRGIGMFVATGAKTQIILQRKTNFYKSYIEKIVLEAEALTLDENELIEMIRKAYTK